MYNDAFGHIINLDNSSIIFGSKVEEEKRLALKNQLGIDNESAEGTYLGLPECFNGLKREMLAYIHGRLQNMLMGGILGFSLKVGRRFFLNQSPC